MQKVSGYTSDPSGNAGRSKPLDPESAGLVMPMAAIALASFTGYQMANTQSDEEAAKERKDRIRKNMNRLGKANLELLRAVRKEALSPVVGTFVNPFQGIGSDRYVPSWFTPSQASEPTRADSMVFHALALAATYGLGTAGVKYLLNRVEREKERTQGNTNIEEAVKASMPIISPDPSLKDTAKEEKESMRGLKRNVILKESAYRSKVPKFVQNAVLGIKDPRINTLSGTLKAAVILAAVGAFGTGAVLTKQWADDRDPNRERLKAAEKAARLRALQTRPPAIVGAIDPKIKAQLDEHITSGRLRVTKKPQIDGGMATQEMDPTDTLSRNIAVV